MGTMLKYGSEGAKQFYEKYILARASPGPRDGRHPYPRHGFLHPDRPPAARLTCSSCSTTAFPPATATCGSPTTSELLRAGLHRHPVQPERPARRPERAQLRLLHGAGRGKTYQAVSTRQLAQALSCSAWTTTRRPSRRLQEIEPETGLSASWRTATAYCEAELPASAGALRGHRRCSKCRSSPADRLEGDRQGHLPGHGGPRAQPEHHALPGGRPDALLLDQLRHGHLPRGPHGHAATAAGHRGRPGQRGDPHLPDADLQGEGRRQLQPGRPNYDLFKLAMPRARQAAVPQLLASSTRPSTCSITSRAIPRPRSPTWAAAPG